MSDSLGGTTTYAYDFEDRLTDLTAPWGTVYSFGYDGEGRRTSLTSTAGRDTSYAYTNGLLTALSHAQSGVALTDLVYGYDVDGQLLAITDNLDPTRSLAINYDDLNRLVQVDQGDPAGVTLPIEDYAYDGEGNRLASRLSSLYASNDHNQLLEDDSYTYAYDERGNRVSRTDKATGAVETYTYDFQNRLVGYSSDTTQVTYAYDAVERRIAKTVDGVTTAYILDQLERPDTMEPSNIVLEFTGADLSARWLYSNSVDEPLGTERYTATTVAGSGQSYSLYTDREGSISHIMADATGGLTASYSYDAFGARTTTGSFDQPYGYRGRELDGETGLYHLRWRAYDPGSGMFMQMDPIGFGSGQENLYAYVDNNPFMAGDPMGLVASSEVRAMANGKMQSLGSATRSVSSGVFDLLGDTLTQMAGNWSLYGGGPQQVANALDGGGSSAHGNSHCDNRGQHLYVIYHAATGASRKFGIGNEDQLFGNGAQSQRAINQIKTLKGGPWAHTVLIVIPGGLMARGQAAVIERMMVALTHTLGYPPTNQGLPGNDQDFCPINGKY